ncbi:MAG: hypothetical protein ACPLKQ_07030 [Candidatus Bathyarchaeales archaeon]
MSELGFGTEYEKFVLKSIVGDLIHRLEIKSVCEYPSNSLMGNNSEIFEAYGVVVHRLSRLEDNKKGEYDLVWNFCEIECSYNPLNLIKEMLMLTRRYLLIITQNNRNFGVHLHRVYHFVKKQRWDHGFIAFMSPEPSLRLLRRYGDVLAIGYFDVPWFILDVYESGSFLRRMIPNPIQSVTLELRESKFEGLPNFIKSWLAHHVYIVFEKRG